MIKLIIKQMLNKNKYIVLGISICLILCVFTSLYSTVMINRVAIANGAGVYTVITDANYGDIKEKISRIDAESIGSLEFYCGENVIAYYGDAALKPDLSGRPNYNSGEALADCDTAAIGDEISIFGKSFLVVGIFSKDESEQQIIKIKSTDMNDNFYIAGFVLVLNDFTKIEEYTAFLNSVFGEENVFTYDMAQLRREMVYVPTLYLLVILEIFSLLAMSFIIIFLIKEIKDIINVLRFNGFSFAKVAIGVASVFAIAFTAAYILGSLIYLLFERTVFPTSIIFMTDICYNLRFYEYLLSFAAMTVILLIATLPSLIGIDKGFVEVRHND